MAEYWAQHSSCHSGHLGIWWVTTMRSWRRGWPRSMEGWQMMMMKSHPSFFAALGITALFSAIHCIGWSFAFPSHTEQWLWRISSVAITCLPLASRPLYLMAEWLGNRVAEFLAEMVLIVIILSCIIYVLTRVTLSSSWHFVPAFSACRHTTLFIGLYLYCMYNLALGCTHTHTARFYAIIFFITCAIPTAGWVGCSSQ